MIHMDTDTDVEKRRRDEFICRFYEHVDGLTNVKETDIRPIAEDWGFTLDELDGIIDYFQLKGYVKIAMGNRYHLGLEPEGRDYVESLEPEDLDYIVITEDSEHYC